MRTNGISELQTLIEDTREKARRYYDKAEEFDKRRADALQAGAQTNAERYRTRANMYDLLSEELDKIADEMDEIVNDIAADINATIR